MRFSAVVMAASLAACGSSGNSQHDAAVASDDAIDGDIVDTPVMVDAPTDAFCPSPAAGLVGGPCTADAQCDSANGANDGVCLHGQVGTVLWPTAGYCINKVAVCTDDASCGTGNECVTVNDNSGPFKACLKSCGTGDCACSNDQVCADRMAGALLANNAVACVPGTAGAVDGAACVDFGDCAGSSRCVIDAVERPGGECQRIGCTIGDDTTCAAGGDGHCVDQAQVSTFDTALACVDACTTDADCRQNQGYHCFDGGGTLGKYCRHPHVGDACTNDPSCGSPQEWDCLAGVYPGGLCTLAMACPAPGSEQGCPTGSSVCYDPPASPKNICVDRCTGTGQGTCRTGYQCVDVNPSGTTTLGCVPP